MINRGKKISAIVMALVVCAVTIYAIQKPPSPEYLRQHPEEFRFEDYYYEEAFVQVLKTLLPVGTSKEEAEKILMTYGNACSSVQDIDASTGGFNKNYPVSDLWNSDNHFKDYKAPSNKDDTRLKSVRVLYDKDETVLEIHPQIYGVPAFPRIFGGAVYPKFFNQNIRCSDSGE